jgi:tripartite-type tricarboxylate transporter receptor subunit TctC
MTPTLTRRLACAALAAGLALGPAAHAQGDYPSKPVTLVVPFPPGGSTDTLARSIAEAIDGPLGQPVVVENRPGAGGTVGAHAFARSDPDGHTLLMGVTGSNAISGVLRSDLPYDPGTDFAPVTLVVSAPLAVVVNAESDIRTLQDLIDRARADPDTVTYGTPGVGTSMHMAGELFALEAGARLVHVPYQGSAPALQDLLGGQIDMMFGDVLVTSEHIRSGALRPLAVTSAARHPLLPDVPTVDEAALEGFLAISWQGVFAPAGTPGPILERLHGLISDALATEALQDFFAQRGFMVEGRAPDASAAFVADEIEKWGRVVDAAGLRQ